MTVVRRETDGSELIRNISVAVNRRASLSLLLRYLLFVLFNKNYTVIEIMTITSTAIKKYHKSLAVAVDIKVFIYFSFLIN